MPVEIRLDRRKSLAAQPEKGHNRWHPDIAPVATIGSGERVVLETLDARDGQITPATRDADLPAMNRNVGHPLTGPVAVEGAEPGDLLAVHLDAIEPQPFGWTANSVGFGFLHELYREPHVTRWTIREGYATSGDLPGVRIPGAPFMGVLGVAPSRELFGRWQRREAELAARGGRVRPPEPDRAVPAALGAEAVRTSPPRENGGNVDIRQLVAGTTVYLPVFQRGALFSAGDAHFAQGDGEVCGTAIEMGATLVARLELLKGRAGNRRDLSFESRGAAPPHGLRFPRRYFATTGLCVRRDGRNESEDLTLAARNALLNMIEHVQARYGYDDRQAYHLCSVAVNLHVSQVVDLPNVLVTAFLPLDIFEA
ncbi:MAG: acetamidase/formamidase family protein [Candidatus Lambdaproteobacteria bacterium]|nr:acetamidase/formamidase family protein [Candidatus Lambdaproteobacteria bacterium]